jgi:sister chromatid cohesion protein DCC1
MIGTSNEASASAMEIFFPSIEHEESVQYRLMEVNDHRILSAIESGKKLFIRGGMEDDAVICTEQETFNLRELVTSNMFLVVERDGSRGSVVGTPTNTLEVTFLPRAPGIDKLCRALRAHPYNGVNEQEASFLGIDELHVKRLYGLIPASSKEISDFLQSQGALVIRGNWAA